MKLLSKKAQVGGMQAFIMGIVTVAIPKKHNGF